METKPLTTTQFFRLFPDDETCLTHLFNVRFGQGFACPSCERPSNWYRIKAERAYSCQWCGHHPEPVEGAIGKGGIGTGGSAEVVSGRGGPGGAGGLLARDLAGNGRLQKVTPTRVQRTERIVVRSLAGIAARSGECGRARRSRKGRAA